MGRVCFLWSQQLCMSHLHDINLKVRRKRALCCASLRQVALLKLGIIANLTLFPWKQPAGQLVPVNLRPAGASTPCGLLANSLGGGGLGSPPRVLSCLLFATGDQWIASPNRHFPQNLYGMVAFNIHWGISSLRSLLSIGVLLLTMWPSSLLLEDLKDENRRNI